MEKYDGNLITFVSFDLIRRGTLFLCFVPVECIQFDLSMSELGLYAIKGSNCGYTEVLEALEIILVSVFCN